MTFEEEIQIHDIRARNVWALMWIQPTLERSLYMLKRHDQLMKHRINIFLKYFGTQDYQI